MKKRLLLGLALALGSVTVMAADAGNMIRTSGLNASPDATSQSLGMVRSQESVTILERDGGWYKVKTDAGRTGWVRMANVRLGDTAETREEPGFWGSLFSFTGRSRTSTTTATTGIRGLSEEDINSAVPNPAAVDRLASWQSSAAEARGFAGQAGLAKTDVAELQEGE
ncbi:MAG: SH3 domain-containing protein [Gammaproteobacteria bacterium]|nr:SH3 domain-containing protein [Gammaproteobacteria bacterium]